MIGCGGLKFSQNVSSKALTVWDRQCLEDYEQKDHLLSESMSDGGDCRTAPAKPGLLIIRGFEEIFYYNKLFF